MGALLNGALAEEVQMPLERNDSVGVLARHGQRRVTLAADDLVEGVKADERGDAPSVLDGG